MNTTRVEIVQVGTYEGEAMNTTARQRTSGTLDSPQQYGLKAATAFSVVAAVLAIYAFQAIPCAAKSETDYEKKLEKGHHELQIGNTDKAIKIFSSKVSKYPESGACHTALGQALKRKGKLSEAKAEFRKATEVDPKYPWGHYYLGVSCEQDKEWKSAAESFQKYVDLEPEGGKRKAVEERVTHCKNQI